MASANLDSEAAFADRARKIGLTEDTLQGLLDNGYNTFGRLAFAVSATPTTLTDEAVDAWIEGLGLRVSGFQKASLRRLLFDGVSMAIEEVKSRIEPGLEGHPKKLASAERLDRQARQERALGGLVFTPETRPANSCVDLCVEMLETGVLQYHVPSKWISRAQEAQCLKRDNSINIDSENNLKIATKNTDLSCDVSSEMRLRQAWGRRSLAFDLANLASFRVMEEHVQFLFSVLQRVQPKGFMNIQLSQVIEADKQMFILASNNLMGRLVASAGAAPALDAEIARLSRSPEIMQYLAPLHTPVAPPPAPWKGDPKGGKNGKGKDGKGGKNPGKQSLELPEGCVTKDDSNQPLCFAFNTHGCKNSCKKGRCIKGFHKCWKKGCFGNHSYKNCPKAGA